MGQRVALVTGGSGGIGAAIAHAVAASGAAVIVHYGSDRTAAAAVVDSITAAGHLAAAVQADLSRPEGPEALMREFDSALDGLGLDRGLDILVNNAGVNRRGALERVTVEDFEHLVALNQRAPFFVTQHALPRMRDGGRIVNISSGSARYARPDVISYAMTKGAIEVFTRALAVDVGERGITVNAVAPAALDTDMNAHWLRGDDHARAIAASTTALKKLATPDDIAAVVAFLAIDASGAITGQVIDATNGNRL
ncbi:SDR family NAD(P)-dependent oxidoreductase [Rhodococcus opacus]|uniref:SDR family NAD(P)-dependent oxidoreductase n=1 Tax=Rhodococcus opacus TaxID=37919 RepID=UPI002953CE9E|nr:SDR family oxidoreductase [Rhodococcus opacus]MDV7089595.1 SDR family oxidoreductase [Rhodococcus opacus]